MNNIDVKYRVWHKGLPPRKTKPEIPGWAGALEKPANGNAAQPWHCQPFLSGNTYGLELIYPFDTECRVTCDGNKINFDGDFKGESPWDENGSPPMSSFAHGHYGMTSCLDIMPPEGYVLRLEPHPRFYVDTVGDVPLAITGHIQRFWSRIFFVVFKAPWPGQTHIFRKGEPYAQLLIVPQKISYDIKAMTEEESLQRSTLDSKIHAAHNVCKHEWKSDKGFVFNDKYKQIASTFAKDGMEGVNKLVNKAELISTQRTRSRVIGKKKHDKAPEV